MNGKGKYLPALKTIHSEHGFIIRENQHCTIFKKVLG